MTDKTYTEKTLVVEFFEGNPILNGAVYFDTEATAVAYARHRELQIERVNKMHGTDYKVEFLLSTIHKWSPK